MASYDPILICDTATKIVQYSAPGTKTQVAMKYTGFQKVNEEYGKYRKRIEKQRNRLIKSNPDIVVVVPEGSTSSTSILTSLTDTEASSSVVYFVNVSM